MNQFVPKVYQKEEPPETFFAPINFGFWFRARVLPIAPFVIAAVLITTQIAIPLVFFTTQDKTYRPVESTVLGYSAGFRDFEFSEFDEVQAQGSKSVLGATDVNVPKEFYITIPQLNIEDALVITNSDSLSPDDHIGHYPGSALPGETGNSFLYGHSVLPPFFNPQNYKTIFSTLNKLEQGDEYTVNFNNQDYTYKVDSIEVLPTDQVKPLGTVKPAYLNDSTMVLMTCWPPGTKAKRLQVVSTLVE